MAKLEMPLSGSEILAAGRRLQQARIRAISENIANANSTASVRGGDPYRRKIASFEPVGSDSPEKPVARILRDTTSFRTQYDPSNLAADARGNVKLPNVNVATETADLQMAIRSYQSNLSAMASLDTIQKATADLLK
ncbi:flagellar biosynthesis protein FlgC [Methylobacterium sp. BTF04]|uniref:flagellar basal body rod C-terminal domain-containing protein n=1 Tax=Methylobacterium sp. BTF04 TaxID=2708300 RepID=UPI0013D72A31|nr:flagellar basal body rod C-terminal domain-containing protein [Methylobacterium sp. BTF04]NEU15030.1 flagellar biosynthesis protein FlgC [Methylobacterium sp. BTF04]